MHNRGDINQAIRAAKMAKLKNLKFSSDMIRYRQNPDLWLSERFGEHPRSIIWDMWPGYEAHPWDGDKNPLYQAWLSLAKGNWAAIESATSTGKTYILARVVFWFLDCFDNPLIVTCAPKQEQLKLQLWSEVSRSWDKFLRMRPNAVLTSLRMRKDIMHNTFGDSAEAVGFVAGVGTIEESATRAQGFHRKNMLIIIEEAPGVNPAIIKAFENTSTGSMNLIFAVGNPDNQLDPLHQFATSPGVQSFRISAYDHPNIVTGREIIPGAVTISSLNRRKAKYGADSQFYQSRARGISPKQAVDSLIQYDWIEYAIESAHEIRDNNSWNAVGIDVANSENGDMACVGAGRSNTLESLHEFQCPSATHLAYNLMFDNATLAKKGFANYHTIKLEDFDIDYNRAFCIGVDPIGVGVATLNTFRDNGFEVVALQGRQDDSTIEKDEQDKPLYNFVSLRAQMFWELREDLREKQIRINITDKKVLLQLTKELLAHKWTSKSGKIAVTKKDDVKKLLGGKSPNYADTFAYWNRVRKGTYQTGGTSPMSAGG